jgi:hypothetical protein
MKKLDKLNMALGTILPPSTSRAPIPPCALTITLLSLFNVTIQSPIGPSSLPLVRSLYLDNQAHPPVQSLLSQLDSLHVSSAKSVGDLCILIQESTSLISLSFAEDGIAPLADASWTVIKERIVEFKVIAWPYGATSGSTLASIIDGSKAMKKMILDGVYLSVARQRSHEFLETLKVSKDACRKKNIELWKENFEVGNGKIDLEK